MGKSDRLKWVWAGLYLLVVYMLSCDWSQLPQERPIGPQSEEQTVRAGHDSGEATSGFSQTSGRQEESNKDNCRLFFCTTILPKVIAFADKTVSDPIALFTLVLGLSTIGLWVQTERLARGGEETAKRQLRAYIAPESGGLVDGSMLDPPLHDMIGVPGVTLVFRNSGQTPASRVTTWAQIEIVDIGSEDRLPSIPNLAEQFATLVGAGGTWSVSRWLPRRPTAHELEGVRAGAKGIYVFGRVQYFDIFGRSHWTNFRLVYSGRFPPNQGVLFSTAIGGNEAS